MSDAFYSVLIIGVIALVTALLRFLPFFVFDGRRPIPKVIRYLGSVLSYSVMAMLVVYCLKSISFVKAPFGIPELLCTALVALIHIWKRNTLFSIICGTVCYMVLNQFLF